MTALLPEQITGEEWGRQFTDIGLWRPVVGAVWGITPELWVVGNSPSITRFVAGYPGTCAVFVVNEAMVFKFFPPFAHKDYGRELKLLTELPADVPALPHLLANGVLADRIDWPYLVTRFEPGAPWREKRVHLTAADRVNVAAEVGSTLRALHLRPLPEGVEWPSAADWPKLFVERVNTAPAELAHWTQLPAKVIDEATDLLHSTAWQAHRPCLVHGDVTEDHVLVEGGDGRWELSCLIDWADAEVAGAAYDWVALWFSFCDRDPGLLRATLAAYDPTLVIDAPFVDAMLAYTLLHRFGARIISDIVTPAQQQACESLDDLCRVLFAGLG
jgi:Ser/Thr protein kinase RdoA (MazF antagonist)